VLSLSFLGTGAQDAVRVCRLCTLKTLCGTSWCCARASSGQLTCATTTVRTASSSRSGVSSSDRADSGSG
jgi:hypothetical protein